MKKIDNEWYAVTDEDDIPFSDEQNEKSKNDASIRKSSILNDPRKIDKYLSERVFGQPDATKQCAMFLYNHLHGNNRKQRCMALVGPSGTGKTFLWQCLAELLESEGIEDTKIYITDTSKISETGYVGDSPSSFLYELEEDTSYIIVFDEFCKLISRSNSDSRQSGLQGEYLSLVQPPHPYINLSPSQKYPGVNKQLYIGSYSFCFVGAFSDLADSISEKSKTTGLGFGAQKSQEKAYAKNLTLDDLLSYGLSKELAGRIGNVCNIKPLTQMDYKNLICEFDNSPVKVIEDMYKLPKGFIRQTVLDDEQLGKLAMETFKHELGVRYAYGYLSNLINSYLYDHFDEYQEIKQIECE